MSNRVFSSVQVVSIVLLISDIFLCHAWGQQSTVSTKVPMIRPTAVSYSPSGKQFAVGGLANEQDAPAGGIVSVFDAHTVRLQRSFRQTDASQDDHGVSHSVCSVHEVAYSPDGKILVVGSNLGLKLWDPTSGDELATLSGFALDRPRRLAEVNSLDFSSSGELLASTGHSNLLRVWNPQTRKLEREFEVGYNVHLATFPDGSLIATAGHHNRVCLWRVADGEKLAEVHAEMGPLYGVAVSPKGDQVVAVGEGGEKSWHIAKNVSGKWIFADEKRLTGHVTMPSRSVAFSHDARMLATQGDDGTVVIYDAATFEVAGVLREGGPFAFSPDGKKIAVAHWRREQRGGNRPTSDTQVTNWLVTDVLSTKRLASQAQETARGLVDSLTSPSPNRRMMQSAYSVLAGPQGETATTVLVDALRNPRVKERRLIIFTLSQIAARDAIARRAILSSLRTSQEVDVRTMAATALGQLPSEFAREVSPELIKAVINDESPHVRKAAGRALSKVDPQAYQEAVTQARARGPVVAQVERRDGKLVYQGRSLEEWIQRLSVSYIPNEIFGRPSPAEPLAAIRAIGPDAVPILLEMLEKGNRAIRQAAAAGLETLGPQAITAVDPLLEVLEKCNADSLDIVAGVADALAAIHKDQKDLPESMVRLTHSGKPAARIGASRAVAALSSKHARGVPVLKAALEAASLQQHKPMLTMSQLPGQPTVAWLGKVVADKEAPIDYRVRAAESLIIKGEDALPALPNLLLALAETNIYVSHKIEMAIHKIGPAAVPAIRDAYSSAKNKTLRRQLARVLGGLGDEGRSALLEMTKSNEVESLWWAVASAAWKQDVAMRFGFAARSALEHVGQPVPPWDTQTGAGGAAGFPYHQKPGTAWSIKLLTDAEAPRTLRQQGAYALYRKSREELFPHRKELLNSILNEQDHAMINQLANLITNLGPKAVPDIKKTIARTESDFTRKRLLRVLSGLGSQGREEYLRIVEEADPFRQLTPLEKQALADTKRTNRSLTNGDFSLDLDGWNSEGGATSFRVIARDNGQALSTYGKLKEADTGRLFQCFRVPTKAGRLSFKLHGGENEKELYIALWRDGFRHAHLTGRNDNTPFEVQVDLRPLKGKVVTLEIVDQAKGPWGFIGAEAFRIIEEVSTHTTGGVTPAARFDVYLHGRKGQEIRGYVDTAQDAFIIGSWTEPEQWDNPEKVTWTPLLEELPMTLFAYTTAGEVYDVPENWNGKLEGWTFLQPVESDLMSVAWNRGEPISFWKGSSFGWGGLRNRLGNIVIGKGTFDETKRFRYVPYGDGRGTSDISFDIVNITRMQ